MTTHLAFLRAINLGGKRTFRKDDIRAACEAAGFTDVQTYINTGNVRVTSSSRSRAKVESALEDAFRTAAGFEVPTIIFTRQEFAEIGRNAEALHAERDLERHYIYLLRELLPDPGVVESRSNGDHRAVVRGRACHLLLGPSYQAGEVDPLKVEKLLGITTNRNYNVVTTLAATWC